MALFELHAAGPCFLEPYAAVVLLFDVLPGRPVKDLPQPRRPTSQARVAEEHGAGQEDFVYANLTVRRLLLQQIFDQQTGPSLALKPDLVTLSASARGSYIVFPCR